MMTVDVIWTKTAWSFPSVFIQVWTGLFSRLSKFAFSEHRRRPDNGGQTCFLLFVLTWGFQLCTLSSCDISYVCFHAQGQEIVHCTTVCYKTWLNCTKYTVTFSLLSIAFLSVLIQYKPMKAVDWFFTLSLLNPNIQLNLHHLQRWLL